MNEVFTGIQNRLFFCRKMNMQHIIRDNVEHELLPTKQNLKTKNEGNYVFADPNENGN